MKLYLIRHGESMGNRLGKIQGCQDFPLSPLGHEQAKKVGDFFAKNPFDYIYSSDLTRAFETAKALEAHHNISIQKWEKIREVNLGPFEGRTREEIYLDYPQAKERSILTSGVKGTESIEELTNRCRYIVEQMLRSHQRHSVALVSHGGLISILLMFLLVGDNWHQHHRPFNIDNTGVTLVEWNREVERPTIHYINRNTHLEDSNCIVSDYDSKTNQG